MSEFDVNAGPENGKNTARARRRYNFVWRILRPFLGIALSWRARRGKEDRTRLTERFARYEHRDTLPQNPIWLHAVSVGEAMAALTLADALRACGETSPLLITTNTVTAASRVMAHPLTSNITHLYQPFDHPQIIDRFLRQLDPQLAVFLESDFWPNLICRTAAHGTPVVFASSQMSERAYSRWQKRSDLAAAVFGAAQAILSVDAQQADRQIALGANPELVKIVGSLKLPLAAQKPDKTLMDALRGAAAGRNILIAASTHPDEEEIVLEAAKMLGPDWFTIIAPRHPVRGAAVQALTVAAGIPAKRRALSEMASKSDSVFILDTLGEMDSLFAVGDVVFLGASLVPLGGHNPIEPAAYGLPLISGPHVFKNTAEFNALRSAGVLYDVRDAASLAETARAATVNGKTRTARSRAARQFATEAGNRPQIAAKLCLSLCKGRNSTQ